MCFSENTSFTRSQHFALLSLVRTHHEGGNTWAIGRTYNGYIARRFPFLPSPCFSYVPAKPQCLCGDAAQYNAPTSQDTCSPRYSNLGEKVMLGKTVPITQYLRFAKEIGLAFIGDMRRTRPK